MHHDIPRSNEYELSSIHRIFEDADNAAYHQPIQPNKRFRFGDNTPVVELSNRGEGNVGIIATISTINGRFGTRDQTPEMDEFAILDMHNIPIRNRFNSSEGSRRLFGHNFTDELGYLVIGRKDFIPGSQRDMGFKGIRPGESVIFGRDNPKTADRFNLSQYTSGRHFMLSLDGSGQNFEVTDLGSSNGTVVHTATQLIDVEYEASQRRQHESSRRRGWEESMRDVHDAWAKAHGREQGQARHNNPRIQALREYIGKVSVSTSDLEALIRDIDGLKDNTPDPKRLGKIIAVKYHPDRGGHGLPEEETKRRTALYNAAKRIAGV